SDMYLFCMCVFILCFFFSSRRRHTRSKRDWSSDVCSSDLSSNFWFELESRWPLIGPFDAPKFRLRMRNVTCWVKPRSGAAASTRSEERRVGKEGGALWWTGAARQGREDRHRVVSDRRRRED